MSSTNTTGFAGEELIRIWLEVADRVSAADYFPIDDFQQVSDQARADSLHWARWFFHQTANPHHADKVRRTAHVARADTPDLLRHEYTVQGLDLEVIESRSFTLIRVGRRALDVLALPEVERPRAIANAAQAILHMGSQHHRWDFQLPARIEEGTRFSTNPAADPHTLRSWGDRADGGIRRGQLYFLCFKKIGQILGYDSVRRWFDDEFRKRQGSG